MKCSSLSAVMSGILLLLPSACVFAQQRPAEEWHDYSQGDIQYGSEHSLIRHLAHGNVEYRTETRSLVDFVGTRQEVITSATYGVTPDFHSVSLHVITQQRSGRVEITGAVDGDRFSLTRKSNGLQRSSRIDLRQRPIFRATLPYYLSRLDGTNTKPAATKITIPIIDTESLQIEIATHRHYRHAVSSRGLAFSLMRVVVSVPSALTILR